MCCFNVIAKAMNLNARMIVDVGVLFLGDGKILVVMQPFGVTNCLIQMQFAAGLPSTPFTCRNMTFSPGKQKTSAIPSIVC
jgi:hypothetical protein